MEEPYEPNLLQSLLDEGPLGVFLPSFILFCTITLVLSRVRGCFRPQPINIVRDLGLLCAGPVAAVLYSAMRAMVAVQSNFRGGIDADHLLIYGLGGPIVICFFALLGFILGVISLMLPTKTKDMAG